MKYNKIVNLKWKNCRAGFTLIEVLVAICLLVVALLGMASVTTTVIKGNALSKARTMATTLAKDKLEEVKNTSYSSLAAGTDYATSAGTVQASATGAYYTRAWSITTPATNVKTVTAIVTWSWQGSNRNVTLSTMVTK